MNGQRGKGVGEEEEEEEEEGEKCVRAFMRQLQFFFCVASLQICSIKIHCLVIYFSSRRDKNSRRNEWLSETPSSPRGFAFARSKRSPFSRTPKKLFSATFS